MLMSFLNFGTNNPKNPPFSALVRILVQLSQNLVKGSFFLLLITLKFDTRALHKEKCILFWPNFVEAPCGKRGCHGNKGRFIFLILVSKASSIYFKEKSQSLKNKFFSSSELSSKNHSLV